MLRASTPLSVASLPGKAHLQRNAREEVSAMFAVAEGEGSPCGNDLRIVDPSLDDKLGEL